MILTDKILHINKDQSNQFDQCTSILKLRWKFVVHPISDQSFAGQDYKYPLILTKTIPAASLTSTALLPKYFELSSIESAFMAT